MECIICGHSESTIIFPAGVAQQDAVLKCDNCGLLVLDNASGYSDLSRLEKSSHTSAPAITDQYAEKQILQIPDYANIADFIAAEIGAAANILEIGSNTGAFLNYLKTRGFKAVGLEPNKNAADYAAQKFCHSLINSDLKSAEFNDSEFDAAIMLHVIEHLKNPNIELSEIRRILRPGGLLVIETPSFDSLIFKILKHRERSIRCKGHLFFFTPETLKKLLIKNGFEILRFEYVGRTLTVERFIHNLGIISGSVQLKNFLLRAAEFIRINKLKIKINLKDMQRIYVKNIKSN